MGFNLYAHSSESFEVKDYIEPLMTVACHIVEEAACRDGPGPEVGDPVDGMVGDAADDVAQISA